MYLDWYVQKPFGLTKCIENSKYCAWNNVWKCLWWFLLRKQNIFGWYYDSRSLTLTVIWAPIFLLKIYQLQLLIILVWCNAYIYIWFHIYIFIQEADLSLSVSKSHILIRLNMLQHVKVRKTLFHNNLFIKVFLWY